jgi:hypothetical protein
VTEQPCDEDSEGSKRSAMEGNVEPINKKGKSAGRWETAMEGCFVFDRNL